MLSGFNTNFRYRGVLFHVQTEDSGRANPHVITHLFHGGNIMASYKRDYSMLLDAEDVEDSVRKLMEAQHKTMLKQLSRGEHDAVIGQRLGADVFRAEANSQTTPPSVTEEAPPPSISSDAAHASEEEPPLVVAELTQIGADDVLSNSFGVESILEPEFATELPPMKSEAEAEKSAPEDPGTDEPRKPSQLARVFGERVVSEKPLDEVVMDYLVDNARKRKRQPK